MSDTKIDCYAVTLMIHRVPGKQFRMNAIVNGVTLQHERLARDYATPQDCLVSARHALNEIFKKGGGQ